MKIQRNVLLIVRNDFIFALISRHFIGLTRYFRLWKVMPQIKEPVSNKFNEMELKIQEIIFCKILNFKLNFLSKFKKLNFWFEYLWIFKDKSFYLVHFHSSCKILGRNDKMLRNESKNKIIVVNKNAFQYSTPFRQTWIR